MNLTREAVPDGNKYRDPEPDTLESVRDAGALGPKSDPCKSQKGWRTLRKHGPLNQQDEYIDALTD